MSMISDLIISALTSCILFQVILNQRGVGQEHCREIKKYMFQAATKSKKDSIL